MNESETPHLLDSQDAKQFESWLGLKKDALTWQGRFEKDFTEFWGIFFKDGLPLNEYFKRFNYALIHVKRGPLSSWFSWLQSSLVCYLFVFKEMSIKDISEISNISYDDISLMVRDFYMAHYPELDDDFSELLQVANVLSANTSRTSKSLQEDLDLDEREKIENSPSLLEMSLWRALEVAQLQDVISQLSHGLDTQIGRNGIRLSGGQRQRLAIARMVLSNPQFVILDEATSALDTATEAALHKALTEFLRGRTTLIVAHRLSAVKQADLIYVLEDGRVTQTGTHGELVEQEGLYQTLYGGIQSHA